jgi:hypothetical protein
MKPSNLMTEPVARSVACLPPSAARISTVVRSSSADPIWLAMPRFQIRS